MPQPHDTWAKYYEYVYTATFGNLYTHLTPLLTRYIREIMPNGRIIDYGAGTGRLALPLAQAGYAVTAVEKSTGMADLLRTRAAASSLHIPVHTCSIAAYKGVTADLALAIFTVLSYTTETADMCSALEVVARHLPPGGHFFFDLPGPMFFRAQKLIDVKRPELERQVHIRSTDRADVYTYHEQCQGVFEGEPFAYEDAFQIRNWSLEEIDGMLGAVGLLDTGRAFGALDGTTGSVYRLYRKGG